MATPIQVGKAAPNAKAPGVNVISVRLPRHDIPKKYSIFKFNMANNVDFTNSGQTKLERENNFKEFKSAYDLETMPKFGAGSEYGREQKEEARKKKFGIKIRKYNPHDQPWLLKLGSGKQSRRFKGVRKGGVLENASYYIFTQRADGAFEASPVDEWYDFLPQAKYKALTAEEAEEQFTKRGKTLNHFAIMVSKRIKGAEGGDDDGDAEPGEKKKKGKKAGKALTLTDGDEWADSDDEENEDEEGIAEDKDKDDEEKPKKKKKENKKSKKDESDNEAFEEQDEIDEGKELDYSSGSSSDDEQMYDETGRDDKYQEKGVVDEDGLRKLLDSDEEDEEEEKKDDENEEDEEGQNKEEQNKASDSESSSDSDIDSDPEKDFTSPLLLSKHSDETGNMTSNRSTTPLPDAGANGKRKKPESETLTVNAAKKPKLDVAAGSSSTPAPPAVASSSNSSSTQGEGGIEGLVKRYLTRKPMTLKDLLQKISSKSMQTTEQIAKEVGHILQRLKLDKLKANNKMYFSIKKDSNS